MGFWQLLLFGRKRRKAPKHRRAQPLPRARRAARSAAPKESDPDLYALWLALRREYFPDRPDIDNYCVMWSGRGQKRVLATCFPTKLLVKVARELDDPAYAEWLTPLLYHEMCHACLGRVANASGRMMWHGAEFRALERRHPESKRLDHWIKSGGWSKAVRSDRARRAAAKRRTANGFTR